MLVIHVKDTGCGILPESIANIVSSFDGHARPISDMNNHSKGLGLTIVKQIV